MPEDQLPLQPSSSDAPPTPIIADDDSLSLSDHENRFSAEARQQSQEAPVETPAPEPVAEETPHVDETDDAGPRDPTTGRFLPKKRHRAESAIASAVDVPRINSLTARLRAVEAERDQLRSQLTPPPAPVTSAATPIADDPEPTADKYEDYSKFVAELARWHARQEHRTWEQKRHDAEMQRAREADQRRLTASWTERVKAAQKRYPDFDSIALQSDTTIPQGSLIDAWILEDETGADVLYHLQQHPDEVQSILNQSVLQQAKSLALLAQRFNGHPPSRTAAVATGSAPAPITTPTPRPPNPVRTGPLRTGDEPPDEEVASLADHEKWYGARRPRGM